MSATKTASTAKTVYFCDVAFYIPRKGRVVNTVAFGEHYEKMVQEIMDNVFSYTGKEGLEQFKVKAASVSADFKKTVLMVSHASWKKPYKITVEPGKSGLNALFDYCLHNATCDDETMHEFLVGDDYIGQGAGFSVYEGTVSLSANTPFHYVSMAYHINDTNTDGIFLDVDADYVALAQRWISHLGSVGNTTFTIVNGGTTPIGSTSLAKGDLQYALTVASPLWDAPQTIQIIAGSSVCGLRNHLTDVCLQTVVKTDDSGYKWTIENILEDECGVPQSSIDYREGTYPYRPKAKAKG